MSARGCLLLPLCTTALAAVEPIVIGSASGRIELRPDTARYAVAGPRGTAAHDLAPGTRAAARAEAVARDADGTELVVSRLVALRAADGAALERLARRHRFHLLARYADGTCVVEALADEPLAGAHLAADLAEDPDASWVEAQVRWPARRKATPNDPLFATQWALANDGTVAGTTAGIDIRATAAWDSVRGTGRTIAIVDEGIDYTHPDLAPQRVAALDLDLWESDGGPAGALPTWAWETHGTITAGLALARGFDGAGISGAAPAAGLAPVRLIVNPITDAQAAQALRLGATGTPGVDVSSNSWGLSDLGTAFKPASATLSDAFAHGTQAGRGGRGIIYIFAAGNGAPDDDTAYDGYQQCRQVLAVGALDAHGGVASYSETGANLLLAAPGGDFLSAGAVSTTAGGGHLAPGDGEVGTSYAAPLVAGVAALALEANPDLTWRDVMHLLAKTARPLGGGFQVNDAGLSHHHRQGFGLVDAQAAVAAAPGWIAVPPEASATATGSGTGAIPDGGTRNVSFDLTGVGTLRAESARFTITVTHSRWSDLAFTLSSPAGTQALVAARPNDSASTTRTFSVVCRPFLDEAVAGTWTLAVADQAAGSTGSITAASLAIHGWRPRAIPQPTVAIPATTRAGDASRVIALTGSGFAADAAGLRPVTTAQWSRGLDSGTATVIAVTGDGALEVELPTAALAGAIGDVVQITLTNPPFAGQGGGSGAGIAVTLRANAAPVLADGSVTAAAGGSATVGLGASDADADALTYSATATALGTVNFVGGSLVFAAGGTIGSEMITVTVDDGNGGTANATFSVNVTAAPAAPSGGGGGGGGGCGAGATGAGLLLAGLPWLMLRRRRLKRA